MEQYTVSNKEWSVVSRFHFWLDLNLHLIESLRNMGIHYKNEPFFFEVNVS